MLTGLLPLPGGWSGETFTADSGGERVVVRVLDPHRHPSDHALVLAALHQLVRGLLPVPEVLEARAGDAGEDRPGLFVTAMLPGVRGDLVLADLEAAGRARLGAELGRLAASLGAMPWLRAGAFVDSELTVGPLPGPESLEEWVDRTPLAGFDARRSARLREVARRAQELLDTVSRRCLVHGDLNPKNLLVDPERLTVTGVVDWEFAHAGHPATDLGNLVRFERWPEYVDAVLGELGGVRAERLDLARAADLWSLIDLAGRAGPDPAAATNPVARQAHALVRAIADAGDWHARLDG